MSILIQNGTLLCPDGPIRADLRVAGDRIAEIGVSLPGRDSRIIDAAGKLVFPGFIDTHTHFEMNKGPPTRRQTTGTPVRWPPWQGAPPPYWTLPNRSAAAPSPLPWRLGTVGLTGVPLVITAFI